MSGEGPDTKVIKETLAYYRFKCELQPPLLRRIEPAEMIPARYTLTSIHENFTHPPSDSEDTTDSEDYSDMPELVDADPFPRSERTYGLFRFYDRRAVGRSARM